MRFAICISGGFRNAKQLYPNFKKHILSPLEEMGYAVDVFISSWNSKIPHYKVHIPDTTTYNEIVSLYKPIAINYEIYDQEKRDFLYKDTKMDVFQRYARENPVARREFGRWERHHLCRVCNQYGFFGGKCRCCGGTNIHNHIGMLYMIKRASDILWEHYNQQSANYTYDYVMRTRFDNVYLEDISRNILDMAKFGWLIPEGDDDFEDYGGGANDQLCISTPVKMHIYSSTYDFMYDIAMKYYPTKGGYGIPHISIDEMARKFGIHIIRGQFKYALHKRLVEAK